MPWWTWILVGAVLLGAEMTIVDLELYLAFLGLSALSVGVLDRFVFDMPFWGEWATFGVLSVVAMVALRGPLYRKLQRGASGIEDLLIGHAFALEADVRAGETWRQDVRGTQWTLQNSTDVLLARGTTVTVKSVDGLTLYVA